MPIYGMAVKLRGIGKGLTGRGGVVIVGSVGNKRGNRKMITEQDKTKIIELYLSGLGSDTIGKQLGIHPNTVLKVLKKNGIERRGLRRKIMQEDEPKIVAMYLQGLSAPKIAEQFNVQHTIILRYLEKNGVDRRSAEECHRKYPINEDFFDCIDTEEKAYFLGFLYADGNNSLDANYTRTDLARKDRDILEKFARLIYLDENPEQHVKDYTRKRKTRISYGSYLDICSKHICHVLYDLGCENKKSLTLKFPEWLIDPELQRHFIRGYYDGDGGIYINQVKGRGDSISIISTHNFITNVARIMENRLGVNFYLQHTIKDKDVYRIYATGNRQDKLILDWLYDGATIFLNRKYEKYLELLKQISETDRLILAGTQGYSKRYLSK